LPVKTDTQRAYGNHGQYWIPPQKEAAQDSLGKGPIAVFAAILAWLQPNRENLGKHETLSAEQSTGFYIC
jgi:hypothetical protein